MKKTILIEGMLCGHCEGKVKKELEGICGVNEAKVSAADKQAVISLAHAVESSKLKEAIETAGYTFNSVE